MLTGSANVGARLASPLMGFCVLRRPREPAFPRRSAAAAANRWNIPVPEELVPPDVSGSGSNSSNQISDHQPRGPIRADYRSGGGAAPPGGHMGSCISIRVR